jgi:hypothetical protein
MRFGDKTALLFIIVAAVLVGGEHAGIENDKAHVPTGPAEAVTVTVGSDT